MTPEELAAIRERDAEGPTWGLRSMATAMDDRRALLAYVDDLERDIGLVRTSHAILDSEIQRLRQVFALAGDEQTDLAAGGVPAARTGRASPEPNAA